MQWIYLICFILLSAGLLALFGVKPGDFIDALFRSQRKSATLSDELNVLLGTPAKGFFNQDYELKQILKGTGRADRYEAIKRLSLILFAVGAVLALLIGNVYMVPILGIGFSLIPIWYLRSTAASYKKHLNEELETAISIITTSYLRTEDLIRSVKENLPYINEPVKANFEAFVYEAELINANITSAINSLKMKIPNRVFHEWCGTLIQCQSDRSMKNTLPTINQKFSDVRVVQSELEAMASSDKFTYEINEKNGYLFVKSSVLGEIRINASCANGSELKETVKLNVNRQSVSLFDIVMFVIGLYLLYSAISGLSRLYRRGRKTIQCVLKM